MSAYGQAILLLSRQLHKDYGDEVLPRTNLWVARRDGSDLRNIPLDFRGLTGQTASPAQAER